MRQRLFWFATSAFWLAVTAFWAVPIWLPQQPRGEARAAEARIALNEVARHARREDCWMAIRGGVYDFTAYIVQHPSRPEVITAWCGKEATLAYETKGKGRAHSPYANELLAKYRIGALETRG